MEYIIDVNQGTGLLLGQGLSAVFHTMDMLWDKFQWILPVYMKLISFQSKAPVVCSTITALFIIPPASTKLKGGYTGFTLAVCPSVRPSVDRIVSALYLQQYSSDPFHICTSYQATSEGVSHVMFLSKLKKFEILANSLNL